MVRHQAGVDTRLHGEDHAQGQLRPIVAGGTPQRGQAVRVASAGECRGQPDAAPQIGLAVAGETPHRGREVGRMTAADEP